MSELIEAFRPFLLIATGSIFGSATRIYLTDFFAMLLPAKHWGIMFVNIFAAFFLGLFLAFAFRSGLDSVSESSSLFLFCCVGFIGSMSTVSTFVIEVFNTLRANRLKEFCSLASFSIVGGLLAVAVGFALGDV